MRKKRHLKRCGTNISLYNHFKYNNSMKKIHFLITMAALLFFVIACNDDDLATSDPTPIINPNLEVQLGETDTIFQSDADTIHFTLIASSGGAPLQTVEISGITDLTTLSSSGNTAISSNTVQIAESEKEGFIWDMVYTVAPEIADHFISFTLIDEAESTAMVSFTISVVPDPILPIDTSYTTILINGHFSTFDGALDLHTGISIPSSDSSAEIRDMGNDWSVPANEENWRHQLAGVNGAEMRYINLDSLPAMWSFDDVAIKEVIKEAWLKGEVFTLTDPDGTLVSKEVEEGDLFTVRNGDVYFLIRVDKLNFFIPNTPISDQDHYDLTIKY